MTASGVGDGAKTAVYDASSRSVILTFEKALTAGQLQVRILNGGYELQQATVRDAGPLTYTVIAGANIAPADVDRSGKTATADVNLIKAKVGTSTTVRANVYDVFYDLDGDGKIAASDVALATARV